MSRLPSLPAYLLRLAWAMVVTAFWLFVLNYCLHSLVFCVARTLIDLWSRNTPNWGAIAGLFLWPTISLAGIFTLWETAVGLWRNRPF